jgi:hypothetical protein
MKRAGAPKASVQTFPSSYGKPKETPLELGRLPEIYAKRKAELQKTPKPTSVVAAAPPKPIPKPDRSAKFYHIKKPELEDGKYKNSYKIVKQLIDETEAKYPIKREHIFKHNEDIQGKLGFRSVTAQVPINDGKGYYEILRSDKFPNANIIIYHNDRTKVGHRVALIKHNDRYDYYDPEGRPVASLPKQVQAYIQTKTKTATLGLHENATKHSDSALCARHTLTRACLSHMKAEDYDRAMEEAKAKHNMTADEVVYALTQNSGGLEEHPEPAQSLKTGGIVYGRKYHH